MSNVDVMVKWFHRIRNTQSMQICAVIANLFRSYSLISLVFLCCAGQCAMARANDAILVDMASSPIALAGDMNLAILRVENVTDQRVECTLSHVLSLNSSLAEAEPLHPTLGLDHGAGAKSTIQIDGQDFGDALLTDGDEFTSFESPWVNGYREAVVTIELDQTRQIRNLRWLAADANWIWNATAEFSVDGQVYQTLDSLQSFDMHKKWGLQEFPLREPITFRYLRLRLFNPAGTMNIVRLPKSIQLFDGAENDVVHRPSVGPEVNSGEMKLTLEPMEVRSVPVVSKQPLSAGSYLLSWVVDTNRQSSQRWASIFVKPTDIPDKDGTRRFGINASNVKLADVLSECGFGWVRFENGKWNMSSDARDHYHFTGGIAPWHVNQDSIYQAYRDRNMKVLPYVFQTPEWATSAGTNVTQNRAGYPPKEASDYGDAIYQFVARFGKQNRPEASLFTDDKKSGLNKIDAIELWNEPNLVGPTWAPFVGTIPQYFEVMRAGVEGARRADPNLIVTSCGWAGVEPETIQQMTNFRYSDGTRPLDLVDVINVHFYSGVQEPEVSFEDPNIRKEKSSKASATYLDQLDELVRWRDEHKPTAPIWMTETGNDVGGPIGLSERKQAAKLPRVTMITLARGVDKVFIYRESGSQPSMHAGAGLIRDDGTLRPSWFTMATLMRQLAGFNGRADRLPHEDPNVWILRWTNGDRSIVAAWTIGDETRLDVEWVTGGKLAKSIVDAFGHTFSATEMKTMSLSEFPTYVAF
jgi:hypothetical protein